MITTVDVGEDRAVPEVIGCSCGCWNGYAGMRVSWCECRFESGSKYEGSRLCGLCWRSTCGYGFGGVSYGIGVGDVCIWPMLQQAVEGLRYLAEFASSQEG